MYLIHLQEGPRRTSFWQRHSSVLVAIGDGEDLADEAGEIGLLSQLGLMDGEGQRLECLVLHRPSPPPPLQSELNSFTLR